MSEGASVEITHEIENDVPLRLCGGSSLRRGEAWRVVPERLGRLPSGTPGQDDEACQPSTREPLHGRRVELIRVVFPARTSTVCLDSRAPCATLTSW